MLKWDLNLNLLKFELSGLLFNASFNDEYKADKGIILADIAQEKKELKDNTEISINKELTISEKEFNTLPKGKRNWKV